MSNARHSFEGETIIVTGAAQGIGREVASFFVQAGGTVFIIDSDTNELATSAQAIGAFPILADVSLTSDVEKAVAQVISETGRIDVLVNNAGIVRDRVLWKLSDDDWNSVLDVHLGGTFRFTRACIPHFRDRSYGRVINVTSYTGLHGNVGQANYAAAKAGIIGFTKTAAKELAQFDVTVNAVSPNARTRMVASIPEDKLVELTASIPMHRFAAPAEMASAIAFLACSASSYITGVVLAVDGGLSM